MRFEFDEEFAKYDYLEAISSLVREHFSDAGKLLTPRGRKKIADSEKKREKIADSKKKVCGPHPHTPQTKNGVRDPIKKNAKLKI